MNDSNAHYCTTRQCHIDDMVEPGSPDDLEDALLFEEDRTKCSRNQSEWWLTKWPLEHGSRGSLITGDSMQPPRPTHPGHPSLVSVVSTEYDRSRRRVRNGEFCIDGPCYKRC